MMLEHILVISAYLFFIGIYGLITSWNMVKACHIIIINVYKLYSNLLNNMVKACHIIIINVYRLYSNLLNNIALFFFF
jgi:NADH:ubiquinone oxidoreductase subunit K